MANVHKYRVVATQSHEPASLEEVINRYCTEENLELVSIHPGIWFPATSQRANMLIVFKARKPKKPKKAKKDTNYGSSVGLWQIKTPPYQRDRERFPREAYVDDVYRAFPPAEEGDTDGQD